MFTGLIETIGTVSRAGGSPRRITISSSLPETDVRIGDSVAIDGCCLTVVAKEHGGLTFEAATETLARTTLREVGPGSRVNLERALPIGGRLDGHLVMGHVDGVGVVRSREQRESALYFGFSVPEEVARLSAPRGSIAIAGVSLTVTDVQGEMLFVAVIPHTLEKTTLKEIAPGSRVNLEADLLARYVARLLQGGSGRGSLTVEFLKDKGFL